nr:MAG TPA: hypothetical protein [Caudoviricetes sp.]
MYFTANTPTDEEIYTFWVKSLAFYFHPCYNNK